MYVHAFYSAGVICLQHDNFIAFFLITDMCNINRSSWSSPQEAGHAATLQKRYCFVLHVVVYLQKSILNTGETNLIGSDND